MRRSGWVWWLVVAAVVIGAGVVLGRDRSSGPPLDPTSTDELGTRALTELIEELDAEVTRTVPAGDAGSPAGADAALVLQDRLDDGARQDLLAWVATGGVLVVADPSSPLAGATADVVEGDGLSSGTCTVAAVAGLERIEAEAFVRYGVEPGDASCFGTGDRAWLVTRAEGSGTIVLLGGAAPLVNRNLDEADNAAVVAALLAPRPGTTVAIVYEPVATDGPRTLTDLVPTRVWWALGQLAVAFGIHVAWRAARFGRPVAEPHPVEVPGSLLVEARGQLYRRSASSAGVADRLRVDAGRRIRQHLGLPSGDPLPLAEVASRVGWSPADVAELLDPRPGQGRRDLRHLARRLDDLVLRFEDEAPPEPAHRGPTPDRRGRR